MTAPNESLERVENARTPEIIRTPDEYRGALGRWTERRINILTPFTNISGLAPHHGIFSSSIQLNLDKAAGDVYDGLPFLKKDEFAIAKAGLRKIAEALGISTHTYRTDPRNLSFYWEVKAVASYRGIDGSIITREATKEWDLRDGSPQLKGWTPNQIEEGRKHGLRNAEARAINAAIRECGCGLKQKYTKAELLKPFAIVRVAFLPDMNDPEIKRLVTERAMGGTSALYAPPVHGGLGPVPIEDEGAPAAHHEPRSVGSGSTTPDAGEPKRTQPTDPDPAPTATAVRIVDVKEQEGTNPETKRKWVKFLIIDHHGAEHTTFSRSVRDDAQRLRAAKTWVEIDDEETEDGKYSNIVQIQVAQPADATAPQGDASDASL
jgi:hypothetical protein